jgi:phenylpropionate dioxygenase-like ring-hydroxylating dioxygenase large terminal subunit
VYLQNAWYVAAFDHEVDRELRAMRILGTNLVFYRRADGTPVALENACPHRKLPLSMGRLHNDEVECGYHGLTFNSAGQCTRIPTAKRIPPSLGVRSYPCVSRYGLVWIWMGDPTRGNIEEVFPIAHWQEPGWGRNQGGSMIVDCNYLYITDNLLDPSHVAWVHRSSFGTDDCEATPIDVQTNPSGVIASRWMLNVEVAPFYAKFVTFSGRCDRLQHYEVQYPGYALARAVFVPAGQGGSAAYPATAMVMDSYNFMTPVDERQTRYFWFQMRNFAPDDAQVSSTMDEGVRAAFAEDKLILNAVQRGIDEHPTRNIDLATDRAGLLFRQHLAQMIAREHPTAEE